MQGTLDIAWTAGRARVASAQRRRGIFLFSQHTPLDPSGFPIGQGRKTEFTVSARLAQLKNNNCQKLFSFRAPFDGRKRMSFSVVCKQVEWWASARDDGRRGWRVWGGVDAIWGKTRVWVEGGEGEIKAETTRPARGFGWCKSDFRLTCSECAVPYGPLLLAAGRRSPGRWCLQCGVTAGQNTTLERPAD